MEWWIVVLTSSLVTTGITIAWNFIENRNQFSNAKYMQISSYYRDKSGDDMHKILNSWTDMLMNGKDPEVSAKLSDPLYINLLLKETYLYSSPETCRRLANYQTDNYLRTSGQTDLPRQLVLVAGIIVSLKHDFTGEWVTIEETLKLKLNDYQNHEEGFKKEIIKLKYNKK